MPETINLEAAIALASSICHTRKSADGDNLIIQSLRLMLQFTDSAERVVAVLLNSLWMFPEIITEDLAEIGYPDSVIDALRLLRDTENPNFWKLVANNRLARKVKLMALRQALDEPKPFVLAGQELEMQEKLEDAYLFLAKEDTKCRDLIQIQGL